MVEISQIVVLALGAIICLFSVWGFIAPDKIWKMINGVMDKDWAIHVAVIMRLLLGAALIIAAPQSRFPHVMEVLGWIAIIAAIAILFMGRDRLKKFIAWFQRMTNTIVRVWLLFGFAFGAFLIHSVA
jgi:hypothetical protein